MTTIEQQIKNKELLKRFFYFTPEFCRQLKVASASQGISQREFVEKALLKAMDNPN